MKIYLAGALFTAAERQWNSMVRDELEKLEHVVWLPQEKAAPFTDTTDIFNINIKGINWCDVLVANLDYPDADSGTCWEMGHAWMKKPCAFYRTDIRANGDSKEFDVNLMLSESSTRIPLPFPAWNLTAKEIAEAIDITIRRL